MTKRLERIFENIPPCKSFADIGCDHGFIAQKMIQSGKCSNVTISDISAPSLQKAEKLLKREIELGLVTPVCADGLAKISHQTEVVLIAGMGGEEIIKILNDSCFLPPVLVLQPMKNLDKVRIELQKMGYGIIKDFLFYDKKYYNLLVCKFGEKCEPYSDLEIKLGRTNLQERSEDFLTYLKNEIKAINDYISLIISKEVKMEVHAELALLKEVLNGNK